MSDTAGSPRPARGLLDRVFAPFDSVWLGISLMVVLFVYCSIGSAGIFRYIGGPLLSTESWIHVQLRTDRGLEMTEYEWFHWWPFKVLMGAICLNLTVVTLRRIRLNAINAGVWMIHSGIIILALGSVWYYSTKVEGDAPVVRGEVSITLPGGERLALPAVPGAREDVTSVDGRWTFRVRETEPERELEIEGLEGEKTFAVLVDVAGPQGSFMRRLLADHPERVEDLVFTENPTQPVQPAAVVHGEPLVLDDLQMHLDSPAARWFYLAHWIEKSWALYVREATPDDSGEWIQRPIEGLPLYNDYIASPEDVWLPHGRKLPIEPVDVQVDSEDPADPLAGVPIHIDSYLRYARMEERRVEDDASTFDPIIEILLDDGMGERFPYELQAFHPEHSTADGGFVEFVVIDSDDDVEHLLHTKAATLEVRVDDGQWLSLPVLDFSLRDPSLPWQAVGDTGYELRVEFVEDRLRLSDTMVHSMASVEIRAADEGAPGGLRSYRRWVFDDPRLNRDVSPRDASDPAAQGSGLVLPKDVYDTDERIEVVYRKGSAPRPITIAARPDGSLGVALNVIPGMDGQWFPVEVGEPVALGRGSTLTVRSLSTRGETQVRPYVVPPEERVRNMTHKQSMVRLRFGKGGETYDTWVPFHEYPVRRPYDPAGFYLRRYRYNPARVVVGEGPNAKVYEFIFSRQRFLLPAAVKLDHFELTAHTGGFTGTTQSIRNWTSFVRFQEDDGDYTAAVPVSVNKPVEFGELSFFQAQWDPPSGQRFAGDVPSNGLNYTVLGVGNRNGVMVQLIGCCISVLGMLYAFYYKPILLRRRKAQRGGGGSGARAGLSAASRSVAVSSPRDEHS